MAWAHRWFIGSALLSVAAFGWISTGGTGRLIATEALASFYDYQAASLLRGRLDVPPEALSFEAFVYQGKTYGYFGPTPALLRVPFVALGLGFGALSRLYLLGYFAAALVAGYLILLHTLRALGADPARPRPWLVVLFTANAGMGNTLFFLGSRAYVHHEAILCGATFALWSVWCGLRHHAAPRGRWWIGALAFGLLAVQARPPCGLFALTFIGVVACAHLLREWRAALRARAALPWRASRLPLAIGGLAALGLFSLNGLSYLKFGTFDACPLQYHVQYQPSVDPGRLARFGGKQFHLANLPLVADTYLLRPNFTLTKYFPWVLMGPETPLAEFPGAKMDWLEPTLGFPYAMPALFGLATIGAALAFWRRPAARPLLALIWIAALPLLLAMFTAVAVSHRYTADFCPLFICAAAPALAAADSARARVRTAGFAVLSILTAAGVVITLLLTLYYQGHRVWGVEEEFRSSYAALRRRVDAFFGLSHPEGYDTAALPARRVEASFYLWIAATKFKHSATFPDAMAVYERHLRDQVFFADAHFAAAHVYLQQNDAARAIQAMQKGVAANPAALEWQERLAEALAGQGRTDEAIARYRVVLQLAPNLVVAHNNIGVEYSKIGQLDAAEQHLQRALQLDPNNPNARQNLEVLRAARKK